MEKKFPRHLDALEEIFQCVRAFVEEEHIDKQVEVPVALAIEEVFANMVKYNGGGRGEIAVGMSADDSRILLWVVDEDSGPFDLSTVGQVQTDAPLEDRQVGGLGLHLVKSMVNDITCEHTGRRLKITMVKTLGR